MRHIFSYLKATISLRVPEASGLLGSIIMEENVGIKHRLGELVHRKKKIRCAEALVHLAGLPGKTEKVANARVRVDGHAEDGVFDLLREASAALFTFTSNRRDREADLSAANIAAEGHRPGRLDQVWNLGTGTGTKVKKVGQCVLHIDIDTVLALGRIGRAIVEFGEEAWLQCMKRLLHRHSMHRGRT